MSPSGNLMVLKSLRSVIREITCHMILTTVANSVAYAGIIPGNSDITQYVQYGNRWSVHSAQAVLD